MAITERTRIVYATDDGMEHKTREAAELHQAKLEVEAVLETNQISRASRYDDDVWSEIIAAAETLGPALVTYANALEALP